MCYSAREDPLQDPGSQSCLPAGTAAMSCSFFKRPQPSRLAGTATTDGRTEPKYLFVDLRVWTCATRPGRGRRRRRKGLRRGMTRPILHLSSFTPPFLSRNPQPSSTSLSSPTYCTRTPQPPPLTDVASCAVDVCKHRWITGDQVEVRRVDGGKRGREGGCRGVVHSARWIGHHNGSSQDERRW